MSDKPEIIELSLRSYDVGPDGKIPVDHGRGKFAALSVKITHGETVHDYAGPFIDTNQPVASFIMCVDFALGELEHFVKTKLQTSN